MSSVVTIICWLIQEHFCDTIAGAGLKVTFLGCCDVTSPNVVGAPRSSLFCTFIFGFQMLRIWNVNGIANSRTAFAAL